MNCLAQEVPVRNAELTSYQQPEEFRKGQKKRGDANPNVLPTSQNPSCWNLSWLSNAHNTRKDPESQWLPRDNLETNSITIKPETVSAWQTSSPGFPHLLLSALAALPNKVSYIVSIVSLDNSVPSIRWDSWALGEVPFLQQNHPLPV